MFSKHGLFYLSKASKQHTFRYVDDAKQSPLKFSIHNNNSDLIYPLSFVQILQNKNDQYINMFEHGMIQNMEESRVLD